jgi:hypothetical protein
MALHGFRQGTVRPPLDRGLVVVGDEPYPHPVFGRPSDRRASAAGPIESALRLRDVFLFPSYRLCRICSLEKDCGSGFRRRHKFNGARLGGVAARRLALMQHGQP